VEGSKACHREGEGRCVHGPPSLGAVEGAAAEEQREASLFGE